MTTYDYHRTNREVYDHMAATQDPLCRPASDAELADPLATVDPAGWLGPSIQGRRVLCLAAGGGRQSSLYAAAGAEVTVVDLSPAMLELDRRVAAERGYALRLFETSMEDLSGLPAAEYDFVIQPVSTCYVPDIGRVFREVSRVCQSRALYISQHKQPISLQASTSRNSHGEYSLVHEYYRGEPVPPPKQTTRASQRLRESGATEYLHRWEQIIGGMCRSGFVIEDLSEPLHARRDAVGDSFSHRAKFIAPYVRIKARKRGSRPRQTNILLA